MAFKDFRARLSGRGMNLRSAFGAGATAGSAITITGIAVGDEIAAAYNVAPPTAGSGGTLVTNLIAEISVSAANTVVCATTNTTGNQVLVFWWAVNP